PSPPPACPLFPYTTLFRSVLPSERRERLLDLPDGGPGVEERAGRAQREQVAEGVARLAAQELEPAELGGALGGERQDPRELAHPDRKSTRLNSSHQIISYA